MSEGADRSERIKLAIEFVKLAFSTLGIVTVLLAVWQWKDATVASKEATYQRITSEWRDHLKTFVERPHLRPYFEETKPLDKNDKDAQAVLAVADLRLDTADAILTYAQFRGTSADIGGWRRTFARAFATSPTLCARLRESQSNYGLIVPVGTEACPLPASAFPPGRPMPAEKQ